MLVTQNAASDINVGVSQLIRTWNSTAVASWVYIWINGEIPWTEQEMPWTLGLVHQSWQLYDGIQWRFTAQESKICLWTKRYVGIQNISLDQRQKVKKWSKENCTLYHALRSLWFDLYCWSTAVLLLFFPPLSVWLFRYFFLFFNISSLWFLFCHSFSWTIFYHLPPPITSSSSCPASSYLFYPVYLSCLALMFTFRPVVLLLLPFLCSEIHQCCSGMHWFSTTWSLSLCT